MNELVGAFACAVVVALTTVLAQRAGIATSIAMLGTGIALSWLPGVHGFELEPDFVLLVLLPPLLYGAGVGLSWRGFRHNLRPILLLAIGCVVFTAVGVAAACNLLFGLPWAVGMVLGAVVSPPDAVAPMAIVRNLGLPRRIETVLEGESLVNDATALVLLSFAIGWVGGEAVQPASMALRFAAVVGGEIVWGLALAWVVLRVRGWMRDPGAETLLALATPFAAFWPPHALGGSGVVAAVAAGLYVSWNGPRHIRPDTRLQGYFVWGTLTASIESLVFLLTGLQASTLVAAFDGLALAKVLGAGVAVTAVVIAMRFVWVFAASYLPRLLLHARDPAPPWQRTAFIALTGLRGAVSLAAALSIPALVQQRRWLLAVTFVVITMTLVGVGSLLPAAVRKLGLAEEAEREGAERKRQEQQARLAGIDAALQRLDALEADGAPKASVASLRRLHRDRRSHLAATADPGDARDPVSETVTLQLAVVEAERGALAAAHATGGISDEARRRVERELDLEDARARHALESLTDVVVADDGTEASDQAG